MSCGGLFLGIRKSTLIGWSSELGGSPLASSMAVIPSDQISAWNISKSLTEMQKNLLVNWKVHTSQAVCKFWSFKVMPILIYLTDTCKEYYNNNEQLSVCEFKIFSYTEKGMRWVNLSGILHKWVHTWIQICRQWSDRRCYYDITL